MSTKELFSAIKHLSVFKWLAIAAIVVAFVCAMWINFGIRLSVEAKDRTVGLVVDYDELLRIADGSNDIEFADMLRKARLAGATGLVVRERLLAEWETAGYITVFNGGQFEFHLDAKYGAGVASVIGDLKILSSSTYILTKDSLVHEQILSMLETKKRYPESFTIPGYMGIEVMLHSSERATLGLGFPLDHLREAAEAGYQIIPRLRNWEPVTEESLQETLSWVAMIPNLAAIGFNDQTLPGGGMNPIIQDRLAEAVAAIGKPLVSFEFYDQVGLPGLAGRMDNNLIRVHAISDNEIRRYTDFELAMDRYSLAATERNIRYIYLRFQELINPAASMLSNMDLITGVRDGLTADGLIVGAPVPIGSYKISVVVLYLLGVGVIAAGGWLLSMAGEPFAKKKWHLPYGILVAFGCVVWAALLVFAPTLSRKFMALAGSIVFPCLGVIPVLMLKPPGSVNTSVIKKVVFSICGLLIMTVVTFVGAMIMSAILAEPVFMLRLDFFRGTKVSHVVPLVLVPLILWLREEDWYAVISGAVKSSVKFWQVGVGLVLLVGLAIYVLRTGNESAELVTGVEVQMRRALDNILGVRPRTKEFLVGHPFTMLLLYLGYKLEYFPLVMVGLVGQISIINTYAHLHTPLAISLFRTANGLWVGILIGIILIVIVEFVMRRMRSLKTKHLPGEVAI